MSSRTGSLNGPIDQFVARIPKDAPSPQADARPAQAVRARAQHIEISEWPAARGKAPGPRPDREAIATAERALADISGALDARYGGAEVGLSPIGARIGNFLDKRQIIDAVLGFGSSVGNDREVLDNLRDKLHLSAEDARLVLDVITSSPAAAKEALEARAAVVGQSATKLANVRRITGAQLEALKSLGHATPLVAGTTAMVTTFHDLISSQSTGRS